MEYYIASDYADLTRRLINGLEAFDGQVYADIVGVPTIGYGYALVVKVGDTWKIKELR